jgi:polysaccharide export outer membrane protein
VEITRGKTMKRIYSTGICVSILVLSQLFVYPMARAEKSVPASQKETTQKGAAVTPDPGSYIIGPGDVLDIMVWKEDDLNREVMVRLDGKITFPLLDDIVAAGRTPLQLKEIIQKKLAGFIESPFVTVSLKGSGSQKFYILGEVVHTGEYPLVKKLTVLQAFALAGGFTEWASKKEILLIREENGKKKTIRINYKEIASGKDLDKDIPIQANDTIVVP